MDEEAQQQSAAAAEGAAAPDASAAHQAEEAAAAPDADGDDADILPSTSAGAAEHSAAASATAGDAAARLYQQQETQQVPGQASPRNEAAAAEEEASAGFFAAESHDQQQEAAGRDAGDNTHRSALTYSSGADLDSEQLHSLSAQTSSLALSSRPMSAAAAGAHLRGSRPNSAAIAATIEGVDNDFVGAAEHNNILNEVPEDNLDAVDPELTTEELIADKQQEYAILCEINDGVQQRARQVLDLRNKGRPAVTGGLSQLDGADTRYRAALKTWVELRTEREDVATHYQTKVFDIKSALEGRIQRAEEIANTLKHFKREVALAAEHSKSGKPIAQKLLADMETKEHALEEEVQRVRLKNIHLGHALKKLESTIRNKEQLAEGLHLIDFEQLKIENQSLNEKIEERNEELVKLRKKTTVTVQILTHMKAKLAFVECENEALQEQLRQLETALAGKRDELASLKSTRDRLWQQQRQLKEGSVFVTNPLLLQDMQVQKEKRDDLLAELELLKQQHAAFASAASASGSRGSTAPTAAGSSPGGRLKSSSSPLHRHGASSPKSFNSAAVKLLLSGSR